MAYLKWAVLRRAAVELGKSAVGSGTGGEGREDGGSPTEEPAAPFGSNVKPGDELAARPAAAVHR